ncbi:MAG: hypothetical protein MPJ78_04940 [Hyphomicrobiaceae bacterium]|nr:hypothetical protein [Hyphomicrobiaceae bacterium]
MDRSANRELHRLAAWFFAGVVAIWVAAMAFVLTTAHEPSEGRVAVVFSPSTTNTQAITAITRAGARPIGQGWLRWVWAVDLDEANAERLKSAGAMLVIREFAIVAALGCAGTAYQPAAPFRASGSRKTE